MDSLISCESYTSLPVDHGFATFFNHLLKNRICVDVTFLIDTPDGEIVEFYGHQQILAMRSSEFADKFYGGRAVKDNRIIPLKNVNCKAFGAMIRYCYGIKPEIASTEDACALFKVASQFKIFSLMELCRTKLRDIKLEPRNVFTMLEVAEYMQDDSLRDMCYKILAEETKEVLAAYELSEVTPVMVHIILDLETLSLDSEYELVKWIIDWGKEKAKEEDSYCEDAREYLQKLLQEMNFLALTFNEFAMLCKENRSFFSSDEISSIYMNIAFPGSWNMPDWYDKNLKFRKYSSRRRD